MTEDYHPSNKSALLDVIHSERAQFEALLEGLTEPQMTAPNVEATWSIKDIVAHITAWEALATDRIRAAKSGAALKFPRITDDAAMDAINAEIFTAHQDQALSEVFEEFQSAHRELLAEIEALEESDLPQKLNFDWSGNLTYQVLISSNTHWHYLEHAAAIEKWLDTLD